MKNNKDGHSTIMTRSLKISPNTGHYYVFDRWKKKTAIFHQEPLWYLYHVPSSLGVSESATLDGRTTISVGCLFIALESYYSRAARSSFERSCRMYVHKPQHPSGAASDSNIDLHECPEQRKPESAATIVAPPSKSSRRYARLSSGFLIRKKTSVEQ